MVSWFYFDQDQRTGITLCSSTLPPYSLEYETVPKWFWKCERWSNRNNITCKLIRNSTFLDLTLNLLNQSSWECIQKYASLTSLLGDSVAQIWEPVLNSLQWALEKTPEGRGQGNTGKGSVHQQQPAGGLQQERVQLTVWQTSHLVSLNAERNGTEGDTHKRHGYDGKRGTK